MEDILDVLGEVDEIVVPRAKGPFKVWNGNDQFKEWDEYEFFNRCRIYKNTANIVLESIYDSINFNTIRTVLCPQV